ncbi:MAG: (Fe-S)-binding protein [Bacteroidales bacterium]
MNTGIFIPCFVDQLYPETGLNMIRILKKADELKKAHMRFHHNPDQTCCGQVAFNGGFWDEAKHLGEKFMRDFMDYDYVVGPSASCVGMVRNYYPQMFYNSAWHNQNKQLSKKIYEFTDFLISVMAVEDLGLSLETHITIHDACTAIREYGLRDQPRRLLQQVKGLRITEMKERDVCCGFGGTFSVKHAAISVAMAEQKVQHALDTGAEYIVSTEASCLMHLQAYIDKQNIPVKTMHIADLLAKALNGSPNVKISDIQS